MKTMTATRKPIWWHSLSFPRLAPGNLVEGKIIKKTPRALYLDLDKYGIGIVWGAEFLASLDFIEDLKIGDQIQAKVINPENRRGFVELSLKEVRQEQNWQEIKEIFQKGLPVVGEAISANRGGLILKVGNFQGFLPTSQMSEEHFPEVENGDKEKILEELEKFIGKKITVQILEFSPQNNKIIFSEKKVKEAHLKELLKQYHPDQIVKARVVKFDDRAVVVNLIDNPELQGIVPFSELDWQPVENPEEILKIGEVYQFKIINLKDDEIKLSLKALKKDPWLEIIEERYQSGKVVKGEVFKFLPIGAVIKLEPEIFGFVHSSEFGGVEEMKRQLELNKIYDFIVENVKIKERRINLKPIK